MCFIRSLAGLEPHLRRAERPWHFNSQDLIANSPLWVLHIFLYINYENFVLDQHKNSYLISLSVLITYLLDNVLMF